MTRRRKLLIALSLPHLSAICSLLPLPASAQAPTKVARIGTLRGGSRPPRPDWRERWGLVERLRELGWVEGKNLVIEDRWADAKTDRLPALAAELVRLKVDVIFAQGWPASVAAKHATATIPIVIYGTGDPVAAGLVSSLARPEGNITGLGDLATELSAKRLQLLKQIVPKLSRVAVLWNSADNGMTARFKDIQSASPTLGVAVRPVGVQKSDDLELAFAAMTRERPDALFVVTDILSATNRKQILEFAAQNRLPVMGEQREWVAEGGLISYGPNFAYLARRAAEIVDKILRGARAGDLPVELPTKVELIVNLKTAKTLGLTIPPSMVVRADEVIE